ncbi:hypothetical protein [Dietzia alimentaria]|uniref:hypothetical protein n=1 Tax=Dietzia alimentaria TaxID=665550 RepID=UPI00029A3C56|nr:hypothetical protein [Dietzia alimentaria]
MSQLLSLEERSRDGSATASPAAGDAPVNTDMTHIAVFPTPLHTLGAAAVGILAGLGAVYLVASRLAGTPAAVAAMVMIFAVTMAGPLVQARAGTELGRVIAVALQSIVFGGVLGALVIVI